MILYSEKQLNKQSEFSDFFQNSIAPFADAIDKNEFIPLDIIQKVANSGFLGSYISQEFQGMKMDPVLFGILNEEAGKACSSIRSLITVQSMVGGIIEHWGSANQKEEWLPKLAKGTCIASFALTEPEHGSDASAISLDIKEEGKNFVLNGKKKWISFAQIADVLLVFGKLNGKICCLLLPVDKDRLEINPINGLIGARGCMLAELVFRNYKLSKNALVGNTGGGLFPVAFTGLDIGRYSIAWGCVGLAQACLDSAKIYTNSREQFGERLKKHHLIKRIITEMMVDIKAARLLCFNAGKYLESGSRNSFEEVLGAKYYSSKMALKVSGHAVQLHGANGLTRNYPVERFYRDSKIMQIIEGSDQMLQLMIARYV